MDESIYGVVGVVGDGKMGRDIALYCAGFPFSIRWLVKESRRCEEKSRLLERRYRRMEKSGPSPENGTDGPPGTWRVSADPGILSDCSIIIECLPEDRTLKQKTLTLIEAHLPQDCVIASTSSSIPGPDLAEGLLRPDMLIGLHFFYPLRLKEFVEVNIWKNTAPYVVDRSLNFLGILGKRHLNLDEPHAFLVNKLLLPLQAAAAVLLLDSDTDSEIRIDRIGFIDDIVGEEILPGGIFRFMDSVGIDILLPSIEAYARTNRHPWYGRLIELLSLMHRSGFTGRNGRDGFYKQGTTVPNPELPDFPPISGSQGIHLRQTPELIRFIFAETGYQAVHEGLVSEELVDEVAIDLTGGEIGPMALYRRINLVDSGPPSWASLLDIRDLLSIM